MWSVLLFIVLAVLQFTDAILTYRVVTQGGRELNIVMMWLIARLGLVASLALTKLLVLVLVACYLMPHTYVLVVLVVIYVLVVCNNWNQLR